MKKLLLLITLAASAPMYGASQAIDKVKAGKALIDIKNRMPGSLWPVSEATKINTALNLLAQLKVTGFEYWEGVPLINELQENWDQAKLTSRPEDDFRTDLIKELLTNVMNATTEEELAVAVDRALSIFLVVGLETNENPKFRDASWWENEERIAKLRYAKNRHEVTEAKKNDAIGAALQSAFQR